MKTLLNAEAGHEQAAVLLSKVDSSAQSVDFMDASKSMLPEREPKIMDVM